MLKLKNIHRWHDDLAPEARSALDAAMHLRTLQDGEQLFSLGDESTECFKVLEGKVKLCNYSVDGRELVWTELFPGDCFGETGVLDGFPRVHAVRAVGNVEIGCWPRSEFMQLYQRFPEISHALNLLLCRRIRFTLAAFEDAVILRLQSRAARLLVRLAYAGGKGAHTEEVAIDVTQEDLAKMLGVTRQAVSRELKQFQQQGLVRVDYKALTITCLAELEKLCNDAGTNEGIVPDYRDS